MNPSLPDSKTVLGLICLPDIPRQVWVRLLNIIIWPLPSSKISRKSPSLTPLVWYLQDTTNFRKLYFPLPPTDFIPTQIYQLKSSQENRITLGLSKREGLIEGIGKTSDGKEDGEAWSHHHLLELEGKARWRSSEPRSFREGWAREGFLEPQKGQSLCWRHLVHKGANAPGSSC